MQKKPWRKLTLLALLAAALCFCVVQVDQVGNQLQYLTEAPAYAAAQDNGDGKPQAKPNQQLADMKKRLDTTMEELSGRAKLSDLGDRLAAHPKAKKNPHFRDRIRATAYEHPGQYISCGNGFYALNYAVA